VPGSDPPRSSDVDDWFVGFDDDRPRGAGGTSPPFTRAPSDDQTRAPDDDWLHEEPDGGRRERGREGRTVKLGTLLAAAAVGLVLILVAGLAVGGVFSSGKKHPTTPTTTPTTTTTSTTTSTTPANPTRSVVAAPTTTLKPGDSGTQVKKLQRALKRLGYSAGAADGVYGAATQAALTRFQKASSLTADGVLGPKTLQALKRALRRHG
jgi:Putative peptidoglycan binding domain